MPSAASAKLEKQASGNQTESSDNNNANTPIRQALVIIEHKIRNLEKRKTKLESYRAIQLSGKELSPDQKAAVSKYDEVAQSLEFARELSKQMLQLATTSEKEQKKQARREVLVRAQAETVKIREVLTIQNILSSFSSDPQVREDFLNGTNGAAKLEEDDLNILEKFYVDIQVKRQKTPEDVPFSTGAQKAAEYLSLTIDGRPKQYGGTTFDNIRRVLNIIQECGYLDKGGKTGEGSEGDGGNEEECSTADDEQSNQGLEEGSGGKVMKNEAIAQDNVEKIDAVNSNAAKQQLQQPPQVQQPIPLSSQQNVGQSTIDAPKFAPEAPSAAAVPAPSFPQQPQQQQQQQQPSQQTTAALVNTQIPSQPPPPPQIPIPIVATQIVAASVPQTPQVAQGPPTVVQPNPLHAGHFPPTTVRAVEQAYFKQHQYIQQMRPLAEVIGSGNFFFLQDSELDSPDLVPAGGFIQNEGQNPAQGSIPSAPNSNTAAGIPNQSVMSQQQTPQIQSQQQQQTQPGQIPTMPQSGGIAQQPKSQQQVPPPSSVPIPTQTFTNQSFPPIVPPPSAMFPPQVVQQNPNEIPSSQPQMQVYASPPLPIPQMVAAGAVAQQQQTVVVSIAAPSVGGGGSLQNPATVLKNIENQQQQGVIVNQQSTLITGPSGANVPLPGFTSAVPTKFPPAPTPPIAIIRQTTNQKSQQLDNYDNLQKPPSQKNVNVTVNDNQIHHQKIDDVVKDRLDRSNDVSNEWDANENLSKPQRVSKKDEEPNQWSKEVANNVNSNEWKNSNYDNQTVETNNWNSSSNQNDSGGGYVSRGRNNFGGSNRSGPGGGGNRGIRGSGGGNGGGGPPSNGYRGGRSNNSYQQQQQQNNRSSGMYFRNNNENTTSGGGGGGGYYHQNHQNGGYNSGSSGKQDGGGSGGYGAGNMNTNYRPRGGPMPSSNRQQNSGGGNRPSGGGGGGSSNTGGGPQPQRNSMNTNRPLAAAGGGGMPANPNRPGGGGGAARTTGGNYGTSRPPNVRQQHQHQQPQQDVNV